MQAGKNGISPLTLLKKIAIVGPESTGKSQLAKDLSQYFQEPWVPEMARAYLEKNGPAYGAADVENIARLQIEAEEQLAEDADAFLFCDTTLLVIKIWMEHAFGHCPDWILASVKQRPYHHYFLCDIDLPWEPDPLREHPQQREFFFKKYHHELEAMNVPYSIISGMGDQRKLGALHLVRNLPG